MFKILAKQELAKDITKIIVEAPQIVRKAKAGQFVVMIIDENGERIPLTLADWNKQEGTISLIFQKVGFTTRKLGGLKVGENIAHILGPLGHPTEIERFGRVVCIGGGVGIAEVYPVAKAFKEEDNQVIGIIGSRSKDLLILEDEMSKICNELFVTTDDGSYGQRGLVTDRLKEILDRQTGRPIARQTDLVYAIGPVPMMKAVSQITRNYGVKTIASLNPIMVDATGMCGACRCTVAGKTVFGCVDGPDFDGHQIDFDELAERLKLFKQEEERKNEKYPT